MRRLGLLLVALCAHLASCGSANPFLADTAREVAIHELTEAEYKRYVKVKNKGYHVVVLENLAEERHEKECPGHCHWMDKQFKDLAEAYLKQRNGGRVYEYDGKQLYFARVNSNSRRPSVVMYKNKDGKGAKYGGGNLLETPKKDTPVEKRIKENRVQVGKELKSVKRADARAERRRRQVSTQEWREEPTYGSRDYHMPWMNNLCKWVRMETRHQFYECPQDVDRNIASTSQKSETGKQVLIAVIGASSLLYVARAFGIILRPVDSSAEDRKRLLHKAKYVALLEDDHVMHSFVDPWWRTWTNLAFIASLVLVSCCASGMYWNFLNKRPLLGGEFAPPFPKFTGWSLPLPMHSVGVATAIGVASLSLLAMGRVATLNYFYLKLPLFFCTCFLWMAAGSFILFLFVENNQYYLHGTFIFDRMRAFLGKR